MKLSVVIPCLNEAETIAIQLEALANQKWSAPWEVILSDNGSTDGTLAIVEKYRERLPNLRIVDASARRGASYARNMGVWAATGEAVVFCDADDEVAPGWIAAMGEALAEYHFVVSQIEDEKLNPPWVKKIWHPSRNGPRKYLDFLPAAATWGIGVKRSLHEAMGGFNESLRRMEDIDYCWRAQLTGVELHFVPDAVVHYRYRSTVADTFRRAFLDGEFQALLYKKYAVVGMPWRSWKSSAWAWIRLLKRLPRLRQRHSRIRWVADFGIHIGRLWGSIKYQVLAL